MPAVMPSLRHLLLLCGFLVWALPAMAQSHDQVLVVRQASAQVETTRGVFSFANVALPFRWDREFPGENGRVQYALTLPAQAGFAAPALYALYIPRLGNQAQIWLNDQLILTPSSLDNARRDSSQHPVFVSIPSLLLKSEGNNQLVIRAALQSLRWGGLSEVYFGTDQALCDRFDFAYFWQQTSYVVIGVALLLMGLISLLMWWRQRERLYLYFVWSALAGCTVVVDHLLREHYLPWPVQGIVAAVALAWHVIFMSRFALEVVGRTENWVSLAMLATTLSIGIAYVLAVPMYWTITYALLCLPLVAALLCTARAADRDKSSSAQLLFVVSLVSALAALRDVFVVHWPVSGMSEFVVMPHALFLFVSVMGWILVRRYTEQHRLYQELNATLEQRVNERETQLADTFKALQAQGEERAKLLERQRIMQDIHDGVGGQLVGLVNMVKRGSQAGAVLDTHQLQEHAQLALDELRMAVDAMQPVGGDLATVLATLRYRLEPRLKATGLALVWEVDDLPALGDLTPRRVLQIQKILLEALTNVILHAKATTVALSVKAGQHAIEIGIADDGVGFDAQRLAVAGHGLANMRFRAEAIGAQLSIAQGLTRGLPQGTIITLQIPL